MSEASSESLIQSYRALVPNSRIPSREQQVRYLQLRIEGMGHVQAARAVKSTGTRFRMLANRTNSELGEALKELQGEIGEARRDRILNTLEGRAFDKDDPASARFLTMLAEAELPQFAYRRTKQHQHSGSFDIRMVPWIDQEKLAELPDEEFIQFMETLSKIRSDKAPVEVKKGEPLKVIEGGKDVT